MPTPRQRWPYGAEQARRDALKAAQSISRRQQAQRDALDLLIARAGHALTERDRATLYEARNAAADTATEAEYIARRLVEARHGEAEE